MDAAIADIYAFCNEKRNVKYMLKYLIILLDRASTSFCHYPQPDSENFFISREILHKAIRFAMMRNLAVQFVYPQREIPDELKAEIETVDSCRIMPVEIADGSADVVVVNGWDFEKACLLRKPTTVRVCKQDVLSRYSDLLPLFASVPKVNVVITDVDTFSDDDFREYAMALDELRKSVEGMFLQGMRVSVNLLTDRMMLKQMNNCEAGYSSLTLSPEGNFYVCPAFYYDDATANSVGQICDDDITIPNSYLYDLKYAPICRHCDAWHCKRCVWLNLKTTREVNTPSHEQCVAAHLEREAARHLLETLNDQGDYAFDSEIPKLDYLDPFDNRKLW